MASITEVKLKDVISLATADTDFSHVLAETAKAEAQALANVESKPVTLRDPRHRQGAGHRAVHQMSRQVPREGHGVRLSNGPAWGPARGKGRPAESGGTLFEKALEDHRTKTVLLFD